MEHYLSGACLLQFLSSSPTWTREPWFVWSVLGANGVLALLCASLGLGMIHVARKRRGLGWEHLAARFGILALACGCALTAAVVPLLRGGFRLAGLWYLAAAAAGLLATAYLMRMVPRLATDPSLDGPNGLGRVLAVEKQAKQVLEAKLKASRDHFRQIVEGIQDYCLILLDPEGKITHWSPGAERMAGYQAKEILGRPFSILFAPEEMEAGQPAKILQEAAAKGRTEYEGWRVRQDGSRFPVNGVVTALYEDGGVLQGFVKVTRDISEQRANQETFRKMAEELEQEVKVRVQELRQSEAKLQGFIHHAPAAIAFKGLDGRFLHLNARMEAKIGLPAAEILGKTNEDLFPDELCASLRERDEQVLRRRVELQVEERWPVRVDGTTRDYLSHKFPLVDETGACWGMGLIDTDITERKKSQGAMLQSQKLESLGVLTGGIAHDFNNLLAAMKGNLHVARNEASQELAQPYFEALNELMDNASNLLTQMLAYAGRGQSVTRTIDLNRLVSDLVNLLHSSLSKKAAIRMEPHPESLLMAADPSQIQQVVMNLVINASEALEDREGTITIRTGKEALTVEAIQKAYPGQDLEPGPYLNLEVSDNGIGMSPEVLEKIFDPFFSTKFTGRGLGLAAIRGIVRNHHGAIRVDSTPGLGSVFKLRFPAAPGGISEDIPEQVETEPPSTPRSEPGAAGPDATGQGSVLVVDDEERIRSIVSVVLGRAGIQTFLARDGREALEVFQRHRDRIRLILMDLAMPNMDGIEACRELRRRGVETPVLLTSGFSERELLPRLKGLRLQGFLKKPFEMEALVRRVIQLVPG